MRLGQRICALLINRVLGGQHQERRRQRHRLAAECHLPLLHGFQQGRLHLGGRAVDFVGQHEVGEHRALGGVILAVLRAVDQRARDVGGQQVGRELDAMERGMDGRGQGADAHGLGQAGHAFEQHVAIGQQPDQQPVHQLLLADDDPANLRAQPTNPAGRSLHLLVQRRAHDPTNLGMDAHRLKLSAREKSLTREGERPREPKCATRQAAGRTVQQVEARVQNFHRKWGYRRGLCDPPGDSKRVAPV